MALSYSPPKRPGYTYVPGKGYVKDAPKATSGEPVLPGSVKNPAGNSVAAVTGGKSVNIGPGNTTLNVRGIQQQLKRAGYDINVDGNLSRTTLSALRDYLQPGNGHSLSPQLATVLKGGPITGNRNPHAWNLRFGGPTTRSKTFVPPAQALDKSGNDTLAGTGSVDLNSASNLSRQSGSPISEQDANFGTMIDPKTADSMAGVQYDSQIHDSRLALLRDPLQATQNQNDITSWYKQAMASLDTAAGRDHAASTAGVDSVKQAAQALVGSLGGSANMGAGNVAAAGENATGTLAAMGAANDQYHNDLVPLLKAEQAGQLVSQRNRDTTTKQNDAAQLANLEGARGQAVNNATAQIIGENNTLAGARAGSLQHIKEYNNQLAQQGFTNSLALAQSKIAALMSGVKLQGAVDRINKNTFLGSSPMTKNQAYQEAMASLYQNGQKLNLTPQQAQTRVASVLSGFGWTPAPGTPAGNFASGIVSTWQTAG